MSEKASSSHSLPNQPNEDHHIPHFMLGGLLYKCLIYTSRSDSCILVLTNGPHLHEVRDKEILRSCNLSATILTDIPPDCRYDIDIFFIYTPVAQIPYYFLHCYNRLVLINASAADHLTITEQCDDVVKYSVTDDTCQPGQLLVRMTATNGIVTETNLKDMVRRHPVASVKRMGHVFEQMKNVYNESRSELATLTLKANALFQRISDDVCYGPKSVRGDSIGEKLMLAKYGDVWVRTHNERLVFGVPVYNCTYRRRRVLTNIRVDMFCGQHEHLVYSSQLFRCRLDDSAVPDFEHLLADDTEEDPTKPPSFEQEWTTNTDGILYPEMAAVCVVTTDLMPFVRHSAYKYQFIVHYNVRDSFDRKIHHLQLNCGSTTVTTSILFQPRYQVTFHHSNYFKDLLTVTATSKLQLIDIRFVDDNTADSCYKYFLVDQLKFSIMTRSNDVDKPNAMDVDDCMSILALDRPMDEPEKPKQQPCDVFYQANDGYFKGTLIRRQKITDNHHRLKIYNVSNAKICSFVQMIRVHFGPFVTIQLADPKCAVVKLSTMQQAAQAEVDLLVGYDYATITNREELERFQMQRLVCERATDRCFAPAQHIRCADN